MVSTRPTRKKTRQLPGSDTISFDEVYNRGLQVMDLTATTMCKENGLPIVVFDMDRYGNLLKLLSGENVGTLVHV